ncbi:unnamed protein product, partial [Laminaria digitata]
GKIQPDVLVFDGAGGPVLGVEVFHKNKVSEEKAEKFDDGLPVIEIAASEILEERTPWQTLRSWGLPTKCSACLAREAEEAEGKEPARQAALAE